LRNSTVSFPSLATIKKKVTTREGWVGDFDFFTLCTPTLNPWSKSETTRKKRETPFYALDEDLPILIAMVCGFQHSLAMLAGVITPPIIFASSIGLSGTPTAVYMVCASLIASGLLSAVQMSRFRIPYTNIYCGTGLITVVGTSFSTLSTASAIFTALYADGTCPMITAADGITMIRGPCPEAYGHLLGTAALCSLLMMGLAFVPPRALKRIFPPVITGMVVMLIGASLIGESGFLNWAGGSGNCSSRPTEGLFTVCPQVGAPHALPWGSAEYIGLGFLSFITIIFVEIFGSPFMRNASIIIGLVVGMIVAGPTGYVSNSNIVSAPVITFLWTTTFPLKIYAPAILPLMAVYVGLCMEVMGDVTASSEASRQPVRGLLYDSRISGGILADGFNGLLSALMTNCPMSIFAQNNGVISITKCANRSAGYWCAGFMIMYGVLAKVSGVFLAIPAPVLGGVTTFLFASVFTSGLKVISYAKFTRRNRIVLASGLSVGIGNVIVHDWASYIFTYDGDNQALKGFMNAITIIVSTPFLIAAIFGIIVNLILPSDPEDDDDAPIPASREESLHLTNVLPRHREDEMVDAAPYQSKEDKIEALEP